ncbi:hypothetical protein [Pseudonocardia sp. NPDC049635]
MLAGLMHLCTVGITWVASRSFMSHCPSCTHLLGRHGRRADGSFLD